MQSPSRRRLLAGSVAAGAAVIGHQLFGRRFSAEWLSGPALPGAERVLRIERGPLPQGAVLTVHFERESPRGDCVRQSRDVTLAAAAVELPFELAYPHEHLVPGAWTYRAILLSEGRELARTDVGYVLRPFTFGV
ncbi:MAG: hypothetical protein IV100_28450 [Myxococcales bacterium]|nr:hypothetical protein [Myxococcales bacterium]